MGLKALTFMMSIMAVAAAWSAEEEHNLGAHRQWEPEALKVVEEKCIVCHNRRRIEEAMSERKEMEKVQESMEQKGVVLTDQERQVLSHFWEKYPYKVKEEKHSVREWR